MARRKPPRTIETLRHADASRKNIPTAEFRSVMERSEQSPVQVVCQRRNRDLDPQLVWRGKDAQDSSDLVVQSPPLFIQEKLHPKVLITRKAPSDAPTRGDVRQGFVYERVPHITLKSIANNAEIDVIWERWQETLEPLRDDLNARLDGDWEEWQIPREPSEDWPAEAVETHRLWWEARIARQEEIDASIAARADYEYLYDKPCEDNRKVRVAGPFTVESLSPHRVLAVAEEDELIDRAAEPRADYGPQQDFAAMILEQLARAGVQQAHKEDRIAFAAVTHWPGDYICAEGRYREGEGDSGPEQRAGIFVGPEFGTVARPDLVAAAREAGDAGFDVLIACAFNYEAHASEFNRLGRIPVLKAA